MTVPTVSQAGDREEPLRQSSDAPSSRLVPSGSPATEAESTRRLLFLDDDPVRAEAFLIDNPQAVWVQTVAECVERLTEHWHEVHLDHDLGGKTFVDVNETDCGMEVIRWLCREPREHLREARFFIHTHNMIAGMLMVMQMRQTGYWAEFRPFGLDPVSLLRQDEDEESLAAERPRDAEVPAPGRPTPGILERFIEWVKDLRRLVRGQQP
jgi:hypothetical protein